MTIDRPQVWRSPGVKLFMIGGLVLLLTVPVALVWFLLLEREGRAQSVLAEVGQAFGGAQRIGGPLLVVPFLQKQQIETAAGARTEETIRRYAVFLPESLGIEGTAQSELRRRSIYDVAIYRGNFRLSGRFAPSDIGGLVSEGTKVLWEEANLVLAISDVRALKENVALELSATKDKIAFEPSVGIPGEFTTGIHALVGANAAQTGFTFSIPLKLGGSQTLSFEPAGRDTAVKLTSNWPHPSFYGAFLPEGHDITKEGFSARWSIPLLARSVPQRWVIQDLGLSALDASEFGVRFYQPVDFYQIVARALKYAVLFIIAVYTAVFLNELMAGRRLHIVQYLFVGFAQIVFYLLLLSLSEHLGFERAYGAASAATVLLITAYTGVALASFWRGFLVFLILVLTYGLLYLLLRLEDYALLVGSLAVFVLLTVTMFATRRVDWSGARNEPEASATST